MKRSLTSAIGPVLVLLLGLILTSPAAVLAQDHVVTPGEIQKDAVGASAARQQHAQQLDGFLSSKEAQQALKSAHMDPQEVKNAVGQLDDEDLARLSARAEKAQREFAAGNLSDRDLLIILVCVAALILIIVAVR
ncbi:MAG TPA: PA2779 family protein [Candidatus Limnocylindrales bacterium]|nr:PA2779 family protein [Candidatus Limnocylindrales bacterium]